jgi:alpha-L-rhamnosidase
MGESCDARRPGADRLFRPDAPGEWEPVDCGAPLNPRVQSHPAPPVRPLPGIVPRSVTPAGRERWIVDLGQNFAGTVRLRVSGRAGDRITLRYAERLNTDGTFYTTNLRGARALDTYICRGGGEEIWEPRFTFHGFQYVELSGVRSASHATVTGIPVTSDLERVSTFECSEAMLNRLASNILWTQRANFIDIPTDCPQRDERLGWTGDAQVYIRSACLQSDAQAFYRKWLVDLTDAQRADGQFPMVAPLKVAGDDGGPAWADAGVICPWIAYEIYGDLDLLQRQYPSMVRFVEFCRRRSTPDLLPPEKFHCFGDWLNINAETPHPVIYTAYFARAADLTARAAEVLGLADDARKHRELFDRIKGAFNTAFVSPEGRIEGNTQTAYALAIAFGLLDGEIREAAARRLVADIDLRGWHLSTGFVGTKELMSALSATGHTDVAYRLLQNETFPSWGFTIRNGATSIWERWDGWTPEKGFQDPGMNSFAHYAFGAVYEWMVENIGGISAQAPGYARVAIAPHPGGTLTHARVGYRSVAGLVSVAWQIAKDRITVRITIPPDVTASIRLPGVNGTVLESGSPAEHRAGLKQTGPGLFEAGSGEYTFTYDYRAS